MNLDKPLVGHGAVVEQLAALLEGSVFPHALLLHGPKGIGKRLLAEKVATRLMCGGTGLEANRNAPVWAQLAAESCPDFYVLEIEKEKKSVGIKQVQALLEALQRSADTARVVIVDCLEDLTTEASNTLLKTLEEPRAGIYFVLLAHQLSGVLATIRSRCRLMRVGPLGEREVAKVLRAERGDEDLATLAEGAPGSVLSADGKARVDALAALQRGAVPAAGPHTMGVLMRHVAMGEKTLQQAELYFELAKLARDAAEMNIPHGLTLDAGMLTVRR